MKTTKKDFELFVKECEYWVNRFKLDDWQIDYFHNKHEPNNCIAKVNTTLTAKSASVTLNSDLADDINVDIKATAKHEIIHILLGELSELGWSRFTTRDEMRTVEESLTRKLENIIN